MAGFSDRCCQRETGSRLRPRGRRSRKRGGRKESIDSRGSFSPSRSSPDTRLVSSGLFGLSYRARRPLAKIAPSYRGVLAVATVSSCGTIEGRNREGAERTGFEFRVVKPEQPRSSLSLSLSLALLSASPLSPSRSPGRFVPSLTFLPASRTLAEISFVPVPLPIVFGSEQPWEPRSAGSHERKRVGFPKIQRSSSYN